MKILPLLIACCLLCPLLTMAQDEDCEILNRVQANGTMLYYMKPEKFYQTRAKSLHGAIATDSEQFYLILLPSPVPSKDTARKIKGDLEVILQDGSKQVLEHFDSYFMEKDTVLALFFVIKNEQQELLLKNQVDQVKLDVGGAEKELYTFMLHKEALRQQLECFIEKKPKKKK
jgi:hypothetical protein